MSVMIKGMEMPKSCYKFIDGEPKYCPFLDADDDCVILLKKGIYTETTWEDQYSKCPLVELPTPHGRLIDADALIHELEYDIELEARYLDNFDGTHTERITSEVNKKIFETAIEILQKASTIIEAEGENVSDD